MSHSDYSHASTSSRANGPMPRQQPDRPVRFVRMSDVEQRLEEAERIRGGCCLCFGGSIWVFDMPDKYDEKDVRDAGASNSPISPGALSSSTASPPPSQPQSRRATAENAEQQVNQPNLTSQLHVSFSPSPPHSPRSPSQAQRRPPKAPSTHSGVSEPTAVDPSISGHTEVDSQSGMPPKAPRSWWQGLRERIFNRPRCPSEEGGQQQNTPENRRHSISLGWYELNVEWD